jgi:hypothetical protein
MEIFLWSRQLYRAQVETESKLVSDSIAQFPYGFAFVPAVSPGSGCDTVYHPESKRKAIRAQITETDGMEIGNLDWMGIVPNMLVGSLGPTKTLRHWETSAHVSGTHRPMYNNFWCILINSSQ